MVNLNKREIQYGGKTYSIISYFEWKASANSTKINVLYLVQDKDKNKFSFWQPDKEQNVLSFYPERTYYTDLKNVSGGSHSLMMIGDEVVFDNLKQEDMILI